MNDSPWQSQASQTALRFCRALLHRGHQVSQVLFYFDGVYQSLQPQELDAGDEDLHRSWCGLAEQHGVVPGVCVAAGQRRLLEEQEIYPFTRISLPVFMHQALQADRVISFGGPG